MESSLLGDAELYVENFHPLLSDKKKLYLEIFYFSFLKFSSEL